jgi:hypothetical protein
MSEHQADLFFGVLAALAVAVAGTIFLTPGKWSCRPRSLSPAGSGDPAYSQWETTRSFPISRFTILAYCPRLNLLTVTRIFQSDERREFAIKT